MRHCMAHCATRCLKTVPKNFTPMRLCPRPICLSGFRRLICVLANLFPVGFAPSRSSPSHRFERLAPRGRPVRQSFQCVTSMILDADAPFLLELIWPTAPSLSNQTEFPPGFHPLEARLVTPTPPWRELFNWKWVDASRPFTPPASSSVQIFLGMPPRCHMKYPSRSKPPEK